MAEAIWTPQEIETLKSLCVQNKTLTQIQKSLPDKTATQIRAKCKSLKLEFNKKRKYWSDEEKKSFEDDWYDPTISYATLRKKYKNRSITALRSYASRLGLGERPIDDTYLTISDIMSEMQVSKDNVRMWIRNGLKHHKSHIKPVKYLIDPKDLLAFLEQHPDFYDASKVSKHIFHNEPAWFKEKRRKDAENFRTRSKKSEYYTDIECKQIIECFKRGQSNAEIAKRFNRTEYGIERILGILGYSRKRYNDYEIDIIKKHCDTHTINEIADMLPLRTKSGIIAKCEQLGIKYHSKPHKKLGE